MSDVGKRATMNQRRYAFDGLHQVREDRFLEQHHHAPDRVEVTRSDRLAAEGQRDQQPRQTQS